MKPAGAIAIAVVACGLTFAGPPAHAQDCPLASNAHYGYTLHLANEEAFRVDQIVDGVTYVRHVDNRGNTIGAQELFGGLFTLANEGARGRSVFTYEVDLAQYFPLRGGSVTDVGGTMTDENGRTSPVVRSWTIGGGGTKYVDAGPDRVGFCLYSVRAVSAVTTWPTLGLEFRQEKLWSDTLNMVLYLRTSVIENGVETRVREYDATWIER